MPHVKLTKQYLLLKKVAYRYLNLQNVERKQVHNLKEFRYLKYHNGKYK